MGEVQTDIYKKMSPDQKWAEVQKLRQIAWEIKKAGVKHQHPEWTEEQIEKEVRRIFLYATT